MIKISNVHERDYPVSESELGKMLDTIASEDDKLWPREWPPVRFDRPLAVGADGGHGPIRYRVSAYEPGRRIEFEMTGDLPGRHVLEVAPGPDDGNCRLRHTLILDPAPLADRLKWALLVRPAHDAVLEGLLDNAGDAVGHPPAERSTWSPWVRLARRLIG